MPFFKEAAATNPSGVYVISPGIFAVFVDGTMPAARTTISNFILFLACHNVFRLDDHIFCFGIFDDISDLPFCKSNIRVILDLPVELLISARVRRSI